MNCQELETIAESDENFAQHVKYSGQTPDGAIIDLIHLAINQDGDAWENYEIVCFIEEICQRFRTYSNRKVSA
jgi:hypothetical protein